MPDFRLPDLGEGLTEGEIVNWLVSVGDEVTVDQPVVEVETAKAVVEVPCPYEGVVSARFGEPGEKLAVGSVLLTVGSDAAESSGNVLIGYGTSEPRRRRPRRRESNVQDARVLRSPHPNSTLTTAPAVISPLVRQLAREHGLPLDRVEGTGPGGVIRRADVERALAARTSAPAPTPTSGPAP
ncbi:MAG: 2-oxo acid dehydrogenase subunit E2, partial [Saccharothrix sp.]|nr:2-oxo acid dehydrogenase subunit E2 [Saccharothrix sp.]